jgi:hypothetical protein
MGETMKTTKYALAVVLGLIALVASAKADITDQVNFTVSITSGTENGDIFTGSYTYDPTKVSLPGNAPLLSFSFSDPAWSGMTLSSPDIVFQLVTPLGLELAVVPTPTTGTPDNGFLFSGTSFIYGTTSAALPGFFASNTDGLGTVSYGIPISITTPEPSTQWLLISGLLSVGIFWRMWRPAASH